MRDTGGGGLVFDKGGDFYKGFRASVPTGLGVLTYGLVFGVLCAETGLSFSVLALMNVAVFSGSAQAVIVGMWNDGFPVWQMAVAAAVVNVRYFLLTAAVAPLMEHVGWLGRAWRVHFVTDENWAITMAEWRRSEVTVEHLVGGGVCVGIFWFSSVMVGHSLGFTLENPEKYALDFAFTALFTALAVNMWRGKRDVLPWLVSAGTAFLAWKHLPGAWYVLLGGISGSAAAVFMKEGD